MNTVSRRPGQKRPRGSAGRRPRGQARGQHWRASASPTLSCVAWML